MALSPDALAATLFPPGIRWWRLETPHFSVFYPEGMAPAAERAAAWAEWAYERLSGDFGYRPGRIRLILTDHADVAHGFATVVPERLVVVFLPPPDSAETIGDYDDWLKAVLVHELTHVFHLEQAHPVYRGLRFLFGRSPLLFPNFLAPDWFTEGLATLQETRWTWGGRACSAETHTMDQTARMTNTYPAIDQAWIARAPWPAGLTAYHFGAAFLNRLHRHHPDTFWPAIRAKNESLWPFFLNAREAHHLGDRFSHLWARWAEIPSGPPADPDNGKSDQPQTHDLGGLEIITRRGYFVSSLRWVSNEICYVNERAHEFPGIFCSDPRTGRTRRVLEGVPAGSFGVDPQGHIVASVLEWRRSFWLRSSLLRVDPQTGRQTRLNGSLRLKDPDVDAMGRIVAVRHGDGGITDLVVLEPDGVLRVVAQDPTVRWSQPRWRPSESERPGVSTFAVVAHRPDATWSLELWTADGHRLAEWLRDRGRKMDPAWSPDGQWLLFVADYAWKLDVWAWNPETEQMMQVVLPGTGFRSPWLTPDTLFVAVYEADGYHPARLPLRGDFASLLRFKPVHKDTSPQSGSLSGKTREPAGNDCDPTGDRGPGKSEGPCQSSGARSWSTAWEIRPTTGTLHIEDGPSTSYSEVLKEQCSLRPPEAQTSTPPPPEIRWNRRSPVLPVIRPFMWFPVARSDELNWRIGVALLGVDRWGYSAYQAVVDYGLDDRLVRYDVLYHWDRWYPTLALRARREIALLRKGVSLATDTYETTLQVPFRRMRSTGAVALGFRYAPLWTVDQTGHFQKLQDRWSIPWTLSYSRALRFPYSVSPEDGWTAIGWGRWGFQGQRFMTLGGDLRGYAPGWRRHHVLALRLTGALSTGPDPEALTLGLESDDLGPVRARIETVLVRRGLVWNVEYRWPVYEIQRSLGLFPLFMERLSVALFYDGAYFTPFDEGTRRSQTVHAVGAEVRLHASAAGFRATGRVGGAVEVGGRHRRRAYIALLLPF
ncbi:MAG: hypothetical protein NZ742_03210 [Acidobacteria bacterium]|nr:hypothetical protein [Acidobacteriota bacterium]MDW7983969.1 hypothetical protein [Acidobacteriota bacterium]